MTSVVTFCKLTQSIYYIHTSFSKLALRKDASKYRQGNFGMDEDDVCGHIKLLFK